MNWDAIGAVGEVVGATGVIASLLYLAIQLKQSSAISRTESFHLAVDQLISGVLQPNFMVLLLKSEEQTLTELEKNQLFPALNCFIYSHEIMYYQWKKGQIENDLWELAFLNNYHFLRLTIPMEIISKREGQISKELKALILERIASET